MKRKFGCARCGKYFTLSDEENEEFENGYYYVEPDICEECTNLEYARE